MMTLLAAAFFLPLFPFSMVLNGMLSRTKPAVLKACLLLVWPQIGVYLLHAGHAQPVSGYLMAWSLISSACYALRLLTVRELGLWAGLLASSSLSLVWGADDSMRPALAFWFSLSSAGLMLLAGAFEKRLGAAYAGLYGALPRYLPRLLGMLVMMVLAAVATPPSPGFFAMLGILQRPSVTLIGLAIWLLWGWAAMILIQGFLSGHREPRPVQDVRHGHTLVFACFLVGSMAASFYLKGGVL